MNSSVKTVVANNGWYSYKNKEIVIIFVHGFLSDSIKCWSSTNKEYWPEILDKDTALEEPSIYLGGFHTTINSVGYDVAQCVAELRDSLELRRGDKVAPIDFPNILFICHSLGGIICRRLLEESSSKFSGKTVGLFLIASPSLGSSYANNLSGLAKLYGNEIAKQLKTDGVILQDIDNRFRSLLVKNSFNKLIGAEICEQHGPLRVKYLPFRMKPIVTSDSASRYFGPVRIIPDTDHSSISKPNSENHKTHESFRHFYGNYFLPNKVSLQLTVSKVNIDNVVEANPLFEVYSKSHQKFYVERELDGSLLQYLKGRSVWIFGTSGVGKTSAAKRAIEKISEKTTEIHLGHIEEESVKEQLLIEIICALNPDENIKEANLHQRAIQLIKERSKETIVPIFLDEVPISSKSTNSIIFQTIGNIIDAVKQTQSSNVNFLISSIVCPPDQSVGVKMRERIEFLEAKSWIREDVEQLFDLLASNLGVAINVNNIRDEVIACSAGLPRFIKSFFRNLLRQESLVLDASLALFHAKQETLV